MAAFLAAAGQFLHLRQDVGAEGLAAEAGLHRHEEYDVNGGKEFRGGLCRGVGVEHDAPAATAPADVLERFRNRVIRFHVNGNLVGPGIGEGVDVEVRIVQHQVHVKEQLGAPAQGGHRLRPEAEIGHEMSVHDVEVDPFQAGRLDRRQAGSQFGVVARKDGRSEKNRMRGAHGDRLKTAVRAASTAFAATSVSGRGGRESAAPGSPLIDRGGEDFDCEPGTDCDFDQAVMYTDRKNLTWSSIDGVLATPWTLIMLPADGSQRLGWFFAGFYLMASASLSLMVLGWQSWVKDIVPERIRGVFFGKRNRLASISSLLFLFLCMALLRWSGNGLWAFQVLITLAVALRAISVLVQHLIHPPPNRVWTETISTAWFDDIRDLVRDRVFMRFVLFGALFGFWNGGIGAYVPVYLLGYLEFTPSQFAACTIIATLTGGLSLPTWGRLCDRFGGVRVAATGLLLWRMWDFLWVIVTPETNWLLYIMWAFGGLVGSGFLLAGFNVLLEVTPRHKSVAGMSLNLCVTSVAAASAPLLAGLWVGFGEARGWEEPMIYRPLLALCFAGCLISVPVLLKLPSRRAEAPLARHAFGSMRTARQQLMSAGLAFLGNVSLAARPWRRSGKRVKRRK